MTIDQNERYTRSAKTGNRSAAQRFSPDYLEAKKSIDDRALNKEVWRKLTQELAFYPATGPLQVLEIGAGIGTMFERVVDWGLLKGEAVYTATDNDPVQTNAAREYLTRWAGRNDYLLQWEGKQLARLRTPEAMVTLIIRQVSVEELASGYESPHSWDLFIAHAVFDLIDFAALLPDLLLLLKDHGLFYSTCNFDGATRFLPSYKGDEEIITRYHESMEKRLSGASHTGRRLRLFLEKQGLDVLASGRSDWFISPGKDGYSPAENSFLRAIIDLVDGELSSGRDTPPDLAAWVRQRRDQMASGTLSFRARHLDLLARCGPLAGI